MSDSLTNYVDFLVKSFGRRISPRLSAEERLTQLVDTEFPNDSAAERSAMVGLVLIRFAELTVTRNVPYHHMTLRSMCRSDA